MASSSLSVAPMRREFVYNGVRRPDPNPALTPTEVREVLAGEFPALTNAAIEGPVPEGEAFVYTFRTAVGDKG